MTTQRNQADPSVVNTNMSLPSQTRRRGRADDRGASLVEFAMVMPLLLMLLFGVIEFAWLFSQNLDVRHGAREGARLVAVNYPDGPQSPTPTPTDTAQTDEIVAEICSRMTAARDATVTLTSPNGSVGDVAVAEVSAAAYALTGFLAWAIPDDLVLTSRVEIRVEQPAGWAPVTDAPCP